MKTENLIKKMESNKYSQKALDKDMEQIYKTMTQEDIGVLVKSMLTNKNWKIYDMKYLLELSKLYKFDEKTIELLYAHYPKCTVNLSQHNLTKIFINQINLKVILPKYIFINLIVTSCIDLKTFNMSKPSTSLIYEYWCAVLENIKFDIKIYKEIYDIYPITSELLLRIYKQDKYDNCRSINGSKYKILLIFLSLGYILDMPVLKYLLQNTFITNYNDSGIIYCEEDALFINLNKNPDLDKEQVKHDFNLLKIDAAIAW